MLALSSAKQIAEARLPGIMECVAPTPSFHPSLCLIAAPNWYRYMSALFACPDRISKVRTLSSPNSHLWTLTRSVLSAIMSETSFCRARNVDAKRHSAAREVARSSLDMRRRCPHPCSNVAERQPLAVEQDHHG